FSSSVHGSEERLATRFVKGLPPYLTPCHLTSNITTWDATTVCHHGRKVPLPGSSVLRSCSPNPLAHTEPLDQVPQGLGVSSVRLLLVREVEAGELAVEFLCRPVVGAGGVLGGGVVPKEILLSLRLNL